MQRTKAAQEAGEVLKNELETEQVKVAFEKEANECWKMVFEDNQVAIDKLQATAKELSKTVAGCRNVYLHSKANEEKLESLQEKVSALTSEVDQLKELVKNANLAHRKAEIGLDKADSTFAGKLLSFTALVCQLNFPYAFCLAVLFPDLVADAASTARYYERLNDPEKQQLREFWAQFQEEGAEVTLRNWLRQLAKLLKLAQPDMEAVFLMLWPREVLPAKFFTLAIRLQVRPA